MSEDFDRHTESRLRVAEAASGHSGCTRVHTGCALYDQDAAALGVSAFVNSECNGSDSLLCSHFPDGCRCEHAEARAIGNAASFRVHVTNVYLTHEPCIECAKAMIALGTVKVVRWSRPFRDHTGADALRDAGIDARHWP